MERFSSELYIRQTTQDMEATPTTSQSDGLVGELVWTNNLQQRTTTIVTISFNVLAALLVIASVLFDAKKATKRGPSLRALNKFYFIPKVHAADTFPLIISTAITTQGIVFLGVQGSALDGLRADGCQAISQVVWPAIWMVAYTLLVFGIEVAFRGFQRKRFQPRGRFTVPICWSIVLTMLIATWVPSQVYKNPKNDCIASLLSWALPWADIALFLNSVLILLYLLIAFLIVYQLSRTAKMDRMERIAASRTVYYIAIAVILMSAVLPYWARIVLDASTNNVARVATTALNIFGLLTGVLYLVLRSNPNNMAFRPGGASRKQKEGWRFFGSPELDMGKHINPVSPENNYTTREIVLASKETSAFEARSVRSRAPSDSTRSYGSRQALISPPSYQTPSKSMISKPPLSSPPSYRAPPIPNANDPSLILPPSFQIPPQKLRSESTFLSFNQGNYTLFPKRSTSTLATENDHVNAARPRPVNVPAPLFANHHRRDTSDLTSATVKIGMRLSTGTVIPGVEERVNRASTYPPVTGKSKQDRQKNSPHLPQRSLDRVPKLLAPPIEMKRRPRDSSPHEILFRLNSNEELSPEAVHITPPSWRKPLEDLVSPTRRMSSWRKFRDRRMKSLPPVPITPSTMPLPPNHRASFPEPRTPATPVGPVRASQEREALSLALKEDEQWPLQRVDMVLLPDKSYTPDKNRSWI